MKICSATQSSTFFSILADEAKDVSKQEQMSPVVRYAECSSGKVYERFLEFIAIKSLTADSLSHIIIEKL